MEFCKYQGTGNDFLIVDGMDAEAEDFTPQRIRQVCDRHFGVGADGFIAAVPSGEADVKMAFFNSDGSRASMCGNGIRCFAKFVRDHGIVKKDVFDVETGDGVKRVSVLKETEKSSEIEVDMGTPGAFRTVETGSFGRLYAVHLGVPHAVRFSGGAETMEALDAAALSQGEAIEYAEEFLPQRTNVNFVSVADSGHILCSTWERGAGKTLACGTGACSSAAAAHRFMGCGSEIRVTMPGGEVVVSLRPDGQVFMRGPAVLICSGTLAE